MLGKKIFFWPFLLLSSGLQAQIVVSGYVIADQNGESLIGASVYDTLSGQGTTTNNHGFFSISFSSGRRVLQVDYPGYEPWIADTMLYGNETFRIRLVPGKMMDEVTVRARPSAGFTNRTQMSAIDLPLQQVRKLPALLGEVDVIKAIQLLPGVKGGNEGSSGLYVRGGGPDQNLILLDGMPLYNVQHMFGFFSVFNADAINSIQLYKGGFPSRYGGRLSSVLDISMKEGNTRKTEGDFSVSPIAFRLSLNGPIGKSGKTTYALSLRRSIFDLLLPRSGENVFYYNFYDLNAKISHRISDKERLYVSFYSGRDKFYTGFNNESTNGNRTARESV
ncbi:MAG: TonB-dependent receptor, partial [Bacteroidia bacterium]